MSPSWDRVWKAPALIAASIAVADQLSKYAILNWQRLDQYAVVQIIPGLCRLVRVHNSGAVWGILPGRSQLLALISLVVIILITVFYRQLHEGRWERGLALGAILGGIAGNLVDRVLRGSVVDFLSFYYGQREWPSFNVADAAICTGVGIYLLSVWLYPQRPDPGGESVATPPTP